jgi:hypothetical protein
MPLQQCERCGRTGYTQLVLFKENISYFFARRHREFSGHLCFSCATKTFAAFEFRTLVGTWWGIIGFFVGPFYILHNLMEYLSATFHFMCNVCKQSGEKWRGLPGHLRRGLLRIYIAITVPWVAWFGYHIFETLQRHRYGSIWHHVSAAFWSMLIVPVGAPILFLVAVWVLDGFRKSAPDINGKPSSGHQFEVRMKRTNGRRTLPRLGNRSKATFITGPTLQRRISSRPECTAARSWRNERGWMKRS